jgi:hypothetical protein
LSTPEPGQPVTDFDRWLAQEFARTNAFTSLVVLVAISATKVVPLCSTYLNIIGTETDWSEIVVLFAGSGQDWDGASFFPATAAHGGPLDNPTARLARRSITPRSPPRWIIRSTCCAPRPPAN